MNHKTKRQHYVWKNYLNAWAVDGRVWCNRNGSVFNTEPTNVAQERNFYSPEPLNEVEKIFLRTDAKQSQRPDIIEFVESEIALRDEMFAALDAAREAQNAEEVTRLEIAIHNAEEAYQGQIENSGIANLADLVAGEYLWARDQGRWRDFIIYFSTQYLRTKRIQETIKKHLGDHPAKLGYSVERLQSVQRHVDAIRLMEGLHRSASLTLLRAPDGVSFITSDQPAFNVNAIIHPANFQSFPHEFYYPVSPKFSAMMVDGTARYGPSCRDLSAPEVDNYNRIIKLASWEQVFGNTKSAVDT